MPFRTSMTLPDHPDVRIFFHGLLLLQPYTDGSYCDVGVHRSTPDHYCSIEVRQKHVDPNIPDIVMMRHMGPVEHPGVTIDTFPASIEGVRAFKPTASFRRNDSSASPGDLRWAIDLDCPEFHGPSTKMQVDTYCTKPDIRVRDGVFYTALRTSESEVLVTRKDGGKGDENMYRIAAIIGANIYLQNNELEITWTDGGKSEKLRLQKPAANSGIHYEIFIVNDPQFTNPEEATHKEFPEYYKAIKNVPTDRQFKLDMQPASVGAAGPPRLTTPRIPCMGIILGG